jgi:hypothetical protein
VEGRWGHINEKCPHLIFPERYPVAQKTISKREGRPGILDYRPTSVCNGGMDRNEGKYTAPRQGGGSPLQPKLLKLPMRSILRPKQPELRAILGFCSPCRAWKALSREPRLLLGTAFPVSWASAGPWSWRGSRAIVSTCSSSTLSCRRSSTSCGGWGNQGLRKTHLC